ncbi:MAG: hypothetical protein NVSMB42_00680 [Herpetosiphon sp.]
MKRLSAYLASLMATTALLAACGGPTTTSTTSTQNTTAAGGATTKATSAPAGGAATTASTTGAAITAPAATKAAATSGAATTGAATAAGTSGAAAGGGAGGVIKIWSSLPRQGSSKGQTDAVVNSIKLRLDEDGNKVCSGKFTIQYEDKDDATAASGKWDATVETSNAQQAVADPDVMVYIGTFNSGAAKLSMPTLNQANLVMISPANTYTGLTKPGKGEPGEPQKYYPSGKRNYTRVVTADDVQGAAAAQWAKDLGVKSVFILDDQEVYGVGVADVFDKKAADLGIKKIDRQGLDPKAPDYRSLATTINSKNPDLVYFGGIVDNNAGQLLKDLRAVGYKGKFMGPDGIQTDSMIQAAGNENSEGMLATIAGTPDDQLGPKGKGYLQKYKDKFGGVPESYGIYGYEAAGAALQGLNQACTKDRSKIRDAVFAIKDFDGALGKWSFDENGDTTLSDIRGYQSKAGKWVLVNVYQNSAWKPAK